MKYQIIGTAGHIDHGKSSIIKELTGFWGDESKEEQRRGITIDLSFSYLKNDDTTLAFIDVPGHESLVSTMISGAFSFATCLFVVDVNEGIKAQSKEHLAVLKYAGLKSCIIVLSKCDLCEKQKILKQKESIKKEVQRFGIEPFEVVEVSIYDKKSIKNLKDILFNLKPQKSQIKEVFQCYIDRVFNIKGTGLVVTGSIYEGSVKVGDKLWVSEKQKACEVRGIQLHESQSEMAFKGQRVALNLSGIDGLKKGYLLTKKGYLRGFKHIDIYLHDSVKHNLEVVFCIGSKKVNGKILNLSENFASFVCEEEIFCKFKDRFVILQNGLVIGGGIVINPITDPIKKLNKLPILKALKQDDFKTAFRLLSSAHKQGFGIISSYQRFYLSHEEILNIIKELDEVFLDEQNLVVYPKSSIQKVQNLIFAIFKKNPNALISPNSLKYKWISKKLALQACENLKQEKKITCINGLWVKVGVDFKKLEQNIEHKIFELIQKGDISPLAPYNIYEFLDIDKKVGDKALKKLTTAKKVVRLEHNFFVSSLVLSSVMKLCRELINIHGFIDIKLLKNKLNLSRKYLIAYLEYLDKFEDIIKIDNKRVLKR